MRLLRLPRSPYWYVEFRDDRNLLRRFSTEITEERLALSYADKLVTLVEYRKAEMDLKPEMIQWVARMPARRREMLARLEILDIESHATFGSFRDHTKAFRAELEARNRNPAYIAATMKEIEAVWAGARCLTLEGIRAGAVSTWLKEQRDGGMSVDTSNHYLTSAKSFLAWCVRSGRTYRNPLAEIRKLKIVHRVRKPRAMTPFEVRRLLKAVEGTDRYWTYRLAIETGLRRNQLKSLTAESFDFRASTVRIDPKHHKGKRSATLPLRLETAAELREWLKRRPKTEPVLRMFYRPSEMLAGDLKRAKIKLVTAQGKLVFHSLRHTAITELARAGVHPKIAQRLAQHASITTTMDIYSHVGDSELRDAVNRLPKVS